MNELKKITHARSKNNGITIYSNKFPIVGVETFLDENENIITKYNLLHFEDFYDISENTKKDTALLIIFNILLIAFSLVFSFFTDNFGFFSAALVFSFVASLETYKFIKSFIKIKFKEPSIARFHAAEHMAINAYNRLQRVPTLEEIKNFSRFSKYCSSQNQLITQLGIFLFMLSTILFYSYNYFIFMGILLGIGAFLLIIKKIKRFLFLQIFFVSKPTDKELNLAIEALKQFENFENNYCSDDLNFIYLNI